jgi:hypothetical protein
MNKRPGQLNVVTEVGYCPFCERPRNLRREQRHLGALVRMTVTCETCHRTLESTMTVAGAEQPAPKKASAANRSGAAAEEPAPAKQAAPARSAAAKPRAKAPAKPKTTTTSRRTAKGK